MRKVLRIVIIIAGLLYIVSPADLMPGAPVDDLLALVLGYIAQRQLSRPPKTSGEE